MIFTVLRRWTVHIHIDSQGHDVVAGDIIVSKDEYQAESFQRILSAKALDLKDSIMRQAAVKWNRPPGMR